jgi:hypothetical protein
MGGHSGVRLAPPAAAVVGNGAHMPPSVLAEDGWICRAQFIPQEVFSMAIHKPLVIANAMRKPHVT